MALAEVPSAQQRQLLVEEHRPYMHGAVEVGKKRLIGRDRVVELVLAHPIAFASHRFFGRRDPDIALGCARTFIFIRRVVNDEHFPPLRRRKFPHAMCGGRPIVGHRNPLEHPAREATAMADRWTWRCKLSGNLFVVDRTRRIAIRHAVAVMTGFAFGLPAVEPILRDVEIVVEILGNAAVGTGFQRHDYQMGQPIRPESAGGRVPESSRR